MDFVKMVCNNQIQVFDIMISSVASIHFRGNENLHTLHLQNTTHGAIIYKMKITHTELFSIAPGRGTVGALQKTLITVKANKLVDVNAKLLVSYAPLTNFNQQDRPTFDQQWASTDKQAHLSIIIPLTRTSHKQPEEPSSTSTHFKKTDSPLYEMEPIAEESSKTSINASRKAEPPIKSLMRSNSSMYRSVEDIEKREVGMSRAETQRIERELEEEREKSRKMKEQLVEREKKILYLNSMRQLEVNKSLGRDQKENWSCLNILLFAFLLLLLGFYLSKYDLPHTFS